MTEINSFKDILNNSAFLYGDKIAFKERGENGKIEKYSYNSLKYDAESLAKALLKRGYEGKKIAISGKNSYLWCLCYLAITCFVGVVVPIDKEAPSEELVNMLTFSDSKLIFSDSEVLLKIKNMPKGIAALSFEDGISQLIEEGKKLKTELLLKHHSLNENEMSVLLFTSGTTGMTKGVMLSQSNICSDLKAVLPCIKINDTDVSLSVLPLHHTYECIAFLMVIYRGGTICFSKSLRNLKEDFSVFKPTVLVAVPLLLEKLHRRIIKNMDEKGKRKKARIITKMSSVISEENRKKVFYEIHEFFGGNLKKIFVGAAELEEDIAKDFSAFGFKIISGYGLTECSPIVICNSVDDITIDSIGKPLNSVKVKIINPDESGIGEIVVKGPMVMKGYYKNEEATEEVLKDGWFKTGDLGFCDKNGYYHITGRKKNVIVSKNGKNIYPEELEHYLMNHSVIAEVIVKSEKGDIITAHILPNEEEIMRKLKKRTLEKNDIKKAVTEAVRQVNKKLPSYKNIRDTVIRTEEFKKTTTHKIKRQ